MLNATKPKKSCLIAANVVLVEFYLAVAQQVIILKNISSKLMKLG